MNVERLDERERGARGVIHGLLISAGIWGLLIAVAVMLMGCASVNEAWMKAYVAVHDAADKALEQDNGKTNAPVVVKPEVVSGHCTCNTSIPVCAEMEDVRQVTIKNSQFEECGLETSEGKPIRPSVRTGNHNLTVSSIYLKQIKTVEGGYEIPCNVQWLGYTWTPIGYSINDDHRDNMQVRFTPDKPHFVPRQFRVFLFVEGRK